MPVRVVIPSSPRVSDRVLERAVGHALAGGGAVRVLVPIVLPPSLPIHASPPRLLARAQHQRDVACRALARAGKPRLADLAQCRSLPSLVRTLCDEEDVAEIVIAGRASWGLRRALHGIKGSTVISDREPAVLPPTVATPQVSGS